MLAAVEKVGIDIDKEIADFPLIPYTSRVYVVEEEIDKVGGIYVPPTARKDGEMQPNMGYVVAVADDVTFCSPGERHLLWSLFWSMDYG